MLNDQRGWYKNSNNKQNNYRNLHKVPNFFLNLSPNILVYFTKRLKKTQKKKLNRQTDWETQIFN